MAYVPYVSVPNASKFSNVMKECVRALKDAKEKPKHTRENIKENSNRYFVETFRNLLT